MHTFLNCVWNSVDNMWLMYMLNIHYWYLSCNIVQYSRYIFGWMIVKWYHQWLLMTVSFILAQNALFSSKMAINMSLQRYIQIKSK